jgi:hypothetical protein
MKAILCVLMLCSACVFGQRRVDVEMPEVTLQSGSFFQAVNGMPVAANVYYRVVEGSAFFDPEWSKGLVAFDKKQYGNVMLKLDLLKNELHFKNSKGEEMICSSPVNRITFGAPGQINAPTFVFSAFVAELSSFKPEAWLQVHAEGRAGLYTHHKKTISETRPYGSATLEQRITTTEIHYLVHNNQYVRVKKLSNILNLLADKKAELQQWIKANNIDESNLADWARVVDAYNNMFPKS